MDTHHTMHKGAATILVIDDEPAFCMVLQEILSANGYGVKTTQDARDALEWLKTSSPSLILTDIMMPEMDGYSLVRALREQEKLAAIPIIVISAKSLPEDRAAVQEAGADDLLSKPFTVKELLHCIQHHFHPN